MTEKKAKYAIEIPFAGSISWGIIFFVIGLIAYRNLTSALMLGIFAFASAVISIISWVPFAGPILWYFANFVWTWGFAIADALGLSADAIVAVAWFFPSIASFIVGLIFTVGLTVAIGKAIIH